MKLSATHAFNCIVLMVKFGRTSCEDILPACTYLDNAEQEQDLHHSTDSNNSTCTQVHNTIGIKMMYKISWYS